MQKFQLKQTLSQHSTAISASNFPLNSKGLVLFYSSLLKAHYLIWATTNPKIMVHSYLVNFSPFLSPVGC